MRLLGFVARQTDGLVRESYLRGIGQLCLCQFGEGRQQHGRHGDFLLRSHLVTREHAEEDRGLRQAIVAQPLRIECQCHRSLAVGRNGRGRHGGLQIVGQVHHGGTDGLRRGVHDVNLLHRHVAEVHIVELHIHEVGFRIGQREGVRAAEVDHLFGHHTTYGEVKGLLRCIAVHGDVFQEVAQLPCIIGGLDGELLAGADAGLGEVGRRAVASRLHTGDLKRLAACVLQFELHRDGVLPQHAAAVDDVVLRRQLLCLSGCCQCS